MRLIKDNQIVETLDTNVISAFKEAGYVEFIQEAKPKAEPPKKTTNRKSK